MTYQIDLCINIFVNYWILNIKRFPNYLEAEQSTRWRYNYPFSPLATRIMQIKKEKKKSKKIRRIDIVERVEL